MHLQVFEMSSFLISVVYWLSWPLRLHEVPSSLSGEFWKTCCGHDRLIAEKSVNYGLTWKDENASQLCFCRWLFTILNSFFLRMCHNLWQFLRYFIHPKCTGSSNVWVRDKIALPNVGPWSFCGATSGNMLLFEGSVKHVGRND